MQKKKRQRKQIVPAMKDGFSEAGDEPEHSVDALNHTADSLPSPPRRLNGRPAVSISAPLDIQAAEKWSEERTAAG